MTRAHRRKPATPSTPARLLLYEDRVPDDVIEGYVALRRAFPDTGDVGETPEAMRALIARYTGPEGSHQTILAREPDGTLSGMTEVFWRPDRPESAHQHFTGVLRTHRGRGLGKALKASMLRFLRARYPDLRHLATSNATTRAPILSINDRRGFASILSTVTYGISRAALAEWLGER